MIIFLLSILSRREFDEPSRIYYAAAIELLILDSFVIGVLYRLVVG